MMIQQSLSSVLILQFRATFALTGTDPHFRRLSFWTSAGMNDLKITQQALFM